MNGDINIIKQQIIKLMQNQTLCVNIDRLATIGKNKDKTIKQDIAKSQEALIILGSNDFFYDYNRPYNSYLDLTTGDFHDVYDNYYDLKTGESQYTGTIDMRSLSEFGTTKNHFYICINSDFSKCYIIDAYRLYLLDKQKQVKWNKSLRGSSNWLGEKNCETLDAVIFMLQKNKYGNIVQVK